METAATISKTRVLFLCVHNSCRSQIAEALVDHRLGDGYLAFSAGSEPTSLDPRAVQVMAEMGIDISQKRSKSVEEFRGKEFDVVITLCAEDYCPTWLGGKKNKLHLPFPNPQNFSGSEKEIQKQYRGLRDEIRAGVRQVLLALRERRKE